MRFINEKNIISGNIFPEKAFQMDIGIKGVIIVTDHPVYPDGKIQAHLKRTYLPFFCMSTDHFSGIYLFGCPKFIDCIVHPVKMSFRIGAFLRCTFR